MCGCAYIVHVRVVAKRKSKNNKKKIQHNERSLKKGGAGRFVVLQRPATKGAVFWIAVFD